MINGREKKQSEQVLEGIKLNAQLVLRTWQSGSQQNGCYLETVCHFCTSFSLLKGRSGHFCPSGYQNAKGTEIRLEVN